MVFQRCFTFLFILLNLFLSTTKVLRNPIKNINITAKLKHYTNVLFFQTIFVCNVLLTILPLSQKTADKLFGKILWNNRLKRNILSNKIERGRDVKCQDIKSLVKNEKKYFSKKTFFILFRMSLSLPGNCMERRRFDKLSDNKEFSNGQTNPKCLP
jgi:hypothetical protein